MDISSDLKCVTNLNEYSSFTQDIVSKCSNSSILFNMSTVLSLKKVKSLEIEYFNKFEENGAAIIVFELILRHPPSKTWGLLGTEIISLVQYWLEAIRKHLIFHNNYWWNFTSCLIKFIERICLKSKSIQDILVQETAECLLDLATNSRTDLNQRYELIRCFNVCCAESSRAIRIALRDKLDTYLARVAGAVRACGDARVQLAGAQALVRWTVPRARRDARAAAAAAWLAPHRYPPPAVAAFVDAAWRNFPQDARGFLNALNDEDSAVVSLRCCSCIAGGAELVTAAGGEHWLDASAGGRSLALHGAADDAVLLLRDEDVDKITLRRAGAGAELRAWGRGAARATLAAGPRALRRLHALLRDVFAHRYTTSAEFDSTLEEEDSRSEVEGQERQEPQERDERRERQERQDRQEWQVPAGAGGSGRARGRATRAGYVAKACAPPPLSPSSASTSSLLMLRDKLSAFSGAVYDKEPVTVSAVPQLSNVTERTEPEDKLHIVSRGTAKAGSCGSSAKSRKFSKDISDSSQYARDKNKFISPIVEEDESNVSCLLVATTGSADDSIVSETLARAPTDRDVDADDIVELLAKEALQYKPPAPNPPDDALDRRDRDGDKKRIRPVLQKQTIISNTTTDDSNTDFVENTPVLVINGSKNLKNKLLDSRDEKNLNFDNLHVENFFSRHLAENSDRDVVVSPTLARKINRSSTESSVELYVDDRFGVDVDVFECINKMLDTVCENLEKCAGYLHVDSPKFEQRDMKQAEDDIANRNDELNEEVPRKKNKTASKKLKLKFDSKNTVVKKGGHNKKKNVLKPVTRSNVANDNLNKPALENVDCEKEYRNKETATCKTPDTRRKRKLYSPKNDHMIDQEIAQADDDSVLTKSKVDPRNKSFNTPYKEIENIRNRSTLNTCNRIRAPRATALSPRTKKLNDIFEGLKNTIEGEKNITFAARNTRNNGAVYNFPTDSEDEDFEQKENKIAKTKKVTKKTTKTKSTRVRKRTVENEKPRKKPTASGRKRKNPTEKGVVDQPLVNLDQMRANGPDRSEPLEISFAAAHSEPDDVDPEPTITSNPKLEYIGIDKHDADETEKLNTRNNNKHKYNKQNTESRSSKKIPSEKSDDKDVTVSPLPALIVEEICRKNTPTSIRMLEDFNMSADNNMFLLNSIQNVLTDTDQRFQLELNVADAASVAASNDSRVGKKRRLSTRKKKLDNTTIKQEYRKEVSKGSDTGQGAINLDTSSEKSIATLGKSPITAHGDFDEAPPSSRLLDRRISKRRGIEAGDLSGTLKDFYDDLNVEIEGPPDASGSSGGDLKRETAASCRSRVASVSKLSPVVSVARLSPDVVSRWLPSRLNSVFASDRSSSASDSSRPTSSRVAAAPRDVEPVEPPARAQLKRASMISPILLFGDNDARRRTRSRTSSRSSPARQVAGDEVFKTPLLRNTSRVSSGRYDLRSGQKTPVLSDSPFEKIKSVSSKRESISENKSPKRRRVSEEARNIDGASSVGEWMSRNDAEDAPGVSENLDLSAGDNIDTVLEKLDTTLQEIHYNTSKKLVSLFVEVGRSYADVQAEREREYRAGVRAVLADVAGLVRARFTALERRCAEAGAAWERGLRERARAVLRDDCRQKRVLVALLRDDLRAARPARTRTATPARARK